MEDKGRKQNKRCRGNYSPKPMGRPMLSQFPSKTWATPIKLPFFPFVTGYDVIRYGISLWLIQVICLVVFPPSPLGTPQSIHWGRQCEKQRGAFMLCKHCSTKARTLVCSQYCFGQKPKAQHSMSCYEEN